MDASADFAAALPYDAGNDIYRIILTGESGAEGVDLKPLRALAADRFYSAELRDETRVARDLWSRAGEDTLTGLFLRRMEQLREENDPALFEQAVRFGLAALENGEDCRP